MKYLGVDFGLRKIGLAVSEGELAAPFKVLHIKNQANAILEIEKIIQQEGIDKIIVGLPESGIRSNILKFVAKLKHIVPVEAADETLSSHGAKLKMIELGIKKEKRIEEDAYSAALILQEYLDNL